MSPQKTVLRTRKLVLVTTEVARGSRVTARGPRLVVALCSRAPAAVDLIVAPTREAIPHFLPDPLASTVGA